MQINTKNKKKDILLIGVTSGIGGTETFIFQELEKINHDKFNIDLLLFQPNNSKYNELIEKYVRKVYRVCPFTGNKLNYLKNIVRFYKKHNYDIIHVNEGSAKLFVYCWPAVFNKKTKIIIHSHNSNDKNVVIHRTIAFLQNRLVDAKWACSNEAAIWMFGKKNVNDKKVLIIKNGVSLSDYHFDLEKRKEIRKKFNLGNKKVIGSVARFEKQKNHDRIIRIFNKYHKQDSNTALVLIGDGSLRKNIEKKVVEYGLEDSVIFLGVRNDVKDFLNAFDVLLLPSLYEGLPFVAVEAQATSLPVLTSENISNEVKITSLVKTISLNDSDNKWINTLKKMYLNDEDRTNNDIEDDFNKNGFNLDIAINKIEQLYEQL